MTQMISTALRRIVQGSTAALVALVVLTGAALANPLLDAYSARQIGERPDGFVQLLDANAPASVRQLVEEINAQRRAAYQSAANQTGAPVAQVGIRAAQRIYAQVPAGTMLLGQDGNWYAK